MTELNRSISLVKAHSLPDEFVKLAYLTEVAALMAAHSRMFIEHGPVVPNQVIGDYYILCRNRFNRWMRDLNDLEKGAAIRDPLHLIGLMSPRPATRSITEQIIINEMLSRVWTVLLIGRDLWNSEDRVRPVVHNVHLGHLSIRHKALSVCVSDSRMSVEDMSAIDKIRSTTERWTDLLCCPMMDEFDLWTYAYDRERAQEYLRDRRDQRTLSASSQAWVLILSGMRHSFPEIEGLAASLHEDDRSITRLMLNSFPDGSPEMTFWMGHKMREAKRN